MRIGTRWYVALLAALVFGTFALASDQAAIDKVWLAKAQTEVKKLLDKYQALVPRLEEVSETRYDKAPGPAGTYLFIPHTKKNGLVRLGENMIVDQLITYDDKPGNPETRLQCDNSDYHFMLTKKKADDPTYVMARQAPGKQKSPLIDQGGFGLHIHAFSYLNDVIDALGKGSTYTLRKLRYDETNGLLQFVLTSKSGETVVEEQIYLDPDHDWRVVEHRVEDKFLVATDRFTYGESVGGLTFPTESKNLSIYKVAKAPPNLEITTRLISIKLTDKVAADFRMSAFGLPEPMGMPAVDRGGIRWYWWLTLAGFVSLILAVVFWKWRGRLQKPEVAPSKS